MVQKYQVYANGQKYWTPVMGHLGAMAVYQAALEEFGSAEIKSITDRSELTEV